MLDSGENSSFPSTAECFNISLNTSSSSTTTSSIISKRKKCKNKRRFSDDQIRSLETMFQTETKLEPKKKVQLARELGLQPRQVAIWFQNKRARWKSKQLDRDYSFLCSNYNNLASQLESLKKEKQFLLVQLQKLNDLIDESEKEGEELCDCRHDQTSDAQAGNCSGPDVVSINTGACNVKSFSTEILIDVKPGLCLERSEYGVVGDRVPSDDESSRANPDYLGSEEEALELFSMVAEPADSSLTFPEEWGSLDSNALLEDQQTRSSCAYQWWDFWS